MTSKVPEMFDRKKLNNRLTINTSTFEIEIDGIIKTRTYTMAGNFIDVGKHQTYVSVKDFSKLPRFVINTATFCFDSHAVNPGWRLVINQKIWQRSVKKTVVRLLHGDGNNQEGVNIRLGGAASRILITSLDDVVSIFDGDFEIVHTHTLAMGPSMRDFKALKHRTLNQEGTIQRLTVEKRELELEAQHLNSELEKLQGQVPSMSAFTDAELLEELHRRTMERLGDYRGEENEPDRIDWRDMDLDNVIDLDAVRKIRFDSDMVRRILEGEEVA
jgi:hypothetical protein